MFCLVSSWILMSQGKSSTDKSENKPSCRQGFYSQPENWIVTCKQKLILLRLHVPMGHFLVWCYTHTHTHTEACTRRHIHACMHARTHAHTHTQRHTHTHRQTHSLTHSHTHALKHTHAHIQKQRQRQRRSERDLQILCRVK